MRLNEDNGKIEDLFVVDGLFTPLLRFLEGVRACQPEREILVVVGELVENRWYQFFLHNQHAQVLKALLWLHGGRNVAVVSTPLEAEPGPDIEAPHGVDLFANRPACHGALESHAGHRH